MWAVPERRTLRAYVAGSNLLLPWITAGQQLSAQRQAGRPKAIRWKAEVTDADEAFGQYVQKEAAQELSRSQCHLALLAPAGIILPAEGDAFLIEGQQAVIGDGHAMGVTT